MAYPYITGADAKIRIGLRETDRIYDDDDDGFADTAALAALARDGSARVASALKASRRYDLALVAANPPSEVIRLSLDVAEVYAARRHPEVVRGKNWVELSKAVEAELKLLVDGDMMLDTDAVLNSDDDGETEAAAGGRPEFASDCDRGW